jgi:5-dehydro-4-deoxyglucarate dehydratase
MTLTPDELRAQLRGVLVFAPTPFRPGTFELDLTGFGQNMEFLAQRGIRAVAVAGFVGEYSALSHEEYIAVLRTARSVFGEGLVIAGIGVGVGVAVEHARTAEQCGADGVMLLPQYLVEPTDDGIVAYTAMVAHSTRCGVMVHSMPGYPFTPTLAERLADVPGVASYKDELGDVSNFRDIVARVGDRLAYVNGRAEPVMAEYAAAGADVLATAIGNFDPELALRAYATLGSEGKDAYAELMAARATPWYQLRQRNRAFLISVNKASMNAVGLAGGVVRPPLTDLAPSIHAELVELMRGVGYRDDMELAI